MLHVLPQGKFPPPPAPLCNCFVKLESLEHHLVDQWTDFYYQVRLLSHLPHCLPFKFCFWYKCILLSILQHFVQLTDYRQPEIVKTINIDPLKTRSGYWSQIWTGVGRRSRNPGIGYAGCEGWGQCLELRNKTTSRPKNFWDPKQAPGGGGGTQEAHRILLGLRWLLREGTCAPRGCHPHERPKCSDMQFHSSLSLQLSPS